MNRRKMTLNEEINQMKKLFGHMNMPLLIRESVGNPVKGGALVALDSGSSIARYVGVGVSKEIEDAIVLASKNSDAITKSLGKQINSFADLEVAYPGLSRSEVAMSVISSMEKQTAKDLVFNISSQLAPVNLYNLKINLTKLTAPEVQSLKTSLSNLESGSLKQLSDPATAEAAAEILPVTITKIKGVIDGISESSMPAATKQSLLDTLDGIEAQVNTKIISKEVEDLVQVSNNQSLGVSQNLSLNNSVISSNSFVYTLDKIDFTKMSLYNASLTKEQLLDLFNKNVSHGLNLVWKSNDANGWNYIPRYGFENWGIPDLRDYMKKNITRMIEVDPSTGRWKVEFGSNSGQPIPVVNKSINVTTGSGTSGYKQIEISPDDFKVGALRVGGKVEETMTEEQLVKLVDEVIQKRFKWLDSPEYKRRRMNATLETSEEVDSAILQIKKYMNEDLKFIFKLDPDKYLNNNLGSASQSAWVYAEKNGLTPNDSSYFGVGVKEIEIQPHKNLETIKGTIDHEVDHIMSATLDGGTTYKAYKNLKSYLGPKLLKLDPKYKEKNPILSLFDTNIGNTTEEWLKYVGNNEESFARLNRLNFWFKEKYGLSDQSELTKGQVDTLWDEYTTKWRRGETPEGYEDIKWLLDGFYETNPWDRNVNKVKMKEDLRTILNASFAIGGLIALNQFGEE